MIDEYQLITLARKLSPNIWYTTKELTAILDVTTTERKTIIVPHFKKRMMVRTRGQTSNIQYKLRTEKDWLIVASLTKHIEKTGNGVIDAKLRKEAKLPPTAPALEKLIVAATELGTDNEILRDKLVRIRKILDEA